MGDQSVFKSGGLPKENACPKMRIKAPKETNLGMAQALSPCTYVVVMVTAGAPRTHQPFSSFQAQALFGP